MAIDYIIFNYFEEPLAAVIHVAVYKSYFLL